MFVQLLHATLWLYRIRSKRILTAYDVTRVCRARRQELSFMSMEMSRSSCQAR